MHKRTYLAALLVPFMLGCDGIYDPAESSRVEVEFQAVTGAGNNPANGPITLTGTNGTLVISDIRLIVAEIELERLNDGCDADSISNDDCEKFEGGPFLVNLLDGTADQVVNAFIPEDTYTEFEFEVEDLNFDLDDTDAERVRKTSVLNAMRAAYPQFPGGASMVVQGTFTPTGGAAQPFTVYFDAEIELELEFGSPFRVPEDGTITVSLSPELWFMTGTSVLNLAGFNGLTVDFEAEFEDGVAEIEFGD